MSLLALHKLCFRIGGRAILNGVEFSVEAGEVHALLGSNGTGKSTLARLVMGCADSVPEAGEIHFDGLDLAGVPLYQRARLGIGMAWQEPVRFEGISVRQFLSLRPGGPGPEQCLARLGLEPADYLERALDKGLSGGERKRIELAALLAQQPKLAILDEPTSGVDVFSLSDILALIQDLKTRGSGVLLITHREEVARSADRASVLCGGRILFCGGAEETAAVYKQRGCLACNTEVCR